MVGEGQPRALTAEGAGGAEREADPGRRRLRREVHRGPDCSSKALGRAPGLSVIVKAESERRVIDLVVVSCAMPTGLHAGRALRRMWECGTGGSVRGSRLGRAKFIKNVDEKGIEPLTSRMLSGRSTPELHALR